jgi:hypothetical protein
MSDKDEEAKALAAEEAAIEMFKVKKLIKSLERARGCVSIRPYLLCRPPFSTTARSPPRPRALSPAATARA